MVSPPLVVDEELAKMYWQKTEAQSIQTTNMMTGSHTVETAPIHVVDGSSIVLATQTFAPSIVNIYAEGLANVLDQYNSHPDKVDAFRFGFDLANGEVSIYNSGPSMPTGATRDAEGKAIYVPEFLCHHHRASSNHDKKSGAQRVSLGAHGLGLKIITSMSTKMTVECADVANGIYYCQSFLDHNKVVTPAVIVPIKKAPKEIRKGGTRFTYLLDYKLYEDLPENLFSVLDSIFRARAYQVAGYSGVDTWYNDERIKVKTPKALAEMHFGDELVHFTLTHKVEKQWPLHVAIGPATGAGPERISIINGGVIPAGVHFDMIIDRIIDDCKDKVEKLLNGAKWKRTRVANNISVLLIGTLPDLIFDSQIKTSLKMKNHKKYFAGFEWPSTYLAKVWPILNVALGQEITAAAPTRTRTKRTLIRSDKHEPARNLGTPITDLLAFEGDSAMSSATVAMGDPSTGFTHEYLGFFTLGGCPINVRKHLTKTVIGDRVVMRPGKMIQDNVVWNEFMSIMGLQYGTKYNTPAALATLNYQRYTNVTDKDLHGMGKIAAIMISNIAYFWPELLDVPGFLGYMDTPLIRAFPKGSNKSTVLEFMTQEDYSRWAAQWPNSIVPEADWEIEWFKGLGTHSPEQVAIMYSNYGRLRVAYTDEQKTALLKCEAYFGKDVEIRKELLSSPPVPIPYVSDRRRLDVGAFCDYNVKEEQQYNITCKLNHCIDNLLMSHRKIIWGAIQHLANGNSKQKVYQIASWIAERTSYHHGDTSINNSIIWLAQDFVGARNIPLFLPLSQFGTRFKADDAASPRYIDTKVNPIINSIYPPADRGLLDMLIEDGSANVPKHLVPVVCMPILETNSLPGTGWAISKWARDYHEHVANIHRLLNGQLPVRMRPWAPGWRGEVVTINGVEWSVGRCQYDEKTRIVTITELPFGTKVYPYIDGNKMTAAKTKAVEAEEVVAPFALSRLPLVEAATIKQDSAATAIKITFRLKPGAIDEINSKYGDQYFSPLIDYLHLKSHMGAMLNFIVDDGTVKTFQSYEAAMIPWFLERWRLYPLRFARQREIIGLKIEMIESKLRYIAQRSDLKLSGLRRAKQIEVLDAARFARIDTGILSSPGQLPTSQLRQFVYGANAKYDYLVKMTDDDASIEGIESLRKKIDKLRAQLRELDSPDIVSRTWLAEIAEVTRQIDKASVEGWVPKGKHKYAKSH